MVYPSDAAGQLAVVPPYAPADKATEVRIVGGLFHPQLEYLCVFSTAGASAQRAVVLSDSELACFTPDSASAIPAESHLSIVQTISDAVIGNFSFQFLPAPIIVDAFASPADADVLVLLVDNLPSLSGHALSWRCEIAGAHYQALHISPAEVVCNFPTASLDQVVAASGEPSVPSVELVAAEVGLASNQFSLVGLVADRAASIAGSDARSILCPEAVGVSSHRVGSFSPFSVNCTAEALRNNSLTALRRRLIDQKTFFKHTSSTPPRTLNLHAELFDYDYASTPGADRPKVFNADEPSSSIAYSVLFPDTFSSSCTVNSNVSCFSTDGGFVDFTSSSADTSENYVSSAIGESRGIDSSGANRFVVLHSVEPYIVNAANASWVTVNGRGFTNSSECVVNNEVALPSVFVSSTHLQCLVAELDYLQHFFLTLKVVDDAATATTSIASANSLTLVYDFHASPAMTNFRSNSGFDVFGMSE